MAKSKLATPQDRTTSTFQRKLNQQNKFMSEMLRVMS